MARFNFVLPSLPTKPVGGVKNMFQFANRLSALGHNITIYYSVKRPFKKQRTPVWLRLAIWKLRRKNTWFVLDKSIQQIVVPQVSDEYVRDADATMCTWWQMAYAINDLSASKGIKINFIQDYELWTGQEDRVHDSYKLPLKHVVIAKYLQEIVEKYNGKRPPLVNTPIDVDQFTLTTPASERDPASLIMMYSEEPRKGSTFGLEALEVVKKKIPSFRVTLFSVYERTSVVPEWMNYYRRPPNLAELYNQHALFFSPSLGEGWGLPPAESMACGCTVVCTNIGGHRDYAIDGQTALLVEPKNVDDMAGKIMSVINQRDLRLRLSEAGRKLIATQFTWETAVAELESILLGKGL
jgi:glycosyltransferase involved in cell wall biosynthesis